MADRTGTANLVSSIISGVESLVGGSTKGKSRSTGSSITEAQQDTTGRTSERLVLEQAAIDQIIRDVLSGPDGLASIFAGEQNAGIFDSSVAAQAAGDLASKLVGELAKITGETVTESESSTTATQSTEQEAASQTEQKDKGILGTIGDKLGF